ncbi:Retinal rod rhodopsin-sensitive cGMP 3',5'-cyclic phosphodiesterase subunit gamma [Liparis tanakae]|uniref:Retinal rod rhodopsin-sensitive cGMP 3',5'-cyclic phosphodiesterase subunit gamma n=1 Tax=Liparis tanakae TaxID=230148 RepID=A0A4Z2FY07_9TELE|nr:Retinal rod rhodopsin-sensitive cGMP 3',5'-cyclic phosphodiesterase subunit gamma [Liparis tanakae]
MNLEPPKAEIKSATRVTGGPATPRKGPPKFKQRQTRQFKSKPPKKGIQGSVNRRLLSAAAGRGPRLTLSSSLSGLVTTSREWRAWAQVSSLEVPGPGLRSWSQVLVPGPGPRSWSQVLVLMRLLVLADITVICPWEAFNHLELNELAKYGII